MPTNCALLLLLLGHFGTQVWLNHVQSMWVFQGGVQLVLHQLCYVVCSDIGTTEILSVRIFFVNFFLVFFERLDRLFCQPIR